MTDDKSFPTVDAAAGRTGTALRERQARRRLSRGAGWRFTRHLLEMLAAMGVGMTVLGAALWLFGEPPGYGNLLVEYGAMGVAMVVPMVAWMRHRGHSWSDGWEMSAAMLVPTFALVLPAELGVGPSADSLMMLAHVTMIGGMVALMIYRWERYTHDHGRSAR